MTIDHKFIGTAVVCLLIVLTIVWLTSNRDNNDGPNALDATPRGEEASSPLLLSLRSTDPDVYLPFVTGGGLELPYNHSFEKIDGGACLYWEDGVGPLTECYSEQIVPEGWTAYWVSDVESYEGGPELRRPEVRPFPRVADPLRIVDGNWAYMTFTFWGPHHMGILQTVPTVPATVTLTVPVDVWFSECSEAPHARPLEKDCTTPLTWADMTVRVGVDPTASDDPFSPDIVWSPFYTVYNGYTELTVSAMTTGPCTILVESKSFYGVKHQNLYLDDLEVSYD